MASDQKAKTISGYGLRKKATGKLLGVAVSSDAYNDGDDCWYSEIEYYLTEYSGEEAIWIVKDKLAAAYTRSLGHAGSCAGYDNPSNPFKPEELEVVKIALSLFVSPVVAKDYPVLTKEEYVKKKYGTKGLYSYDPKWMEFQLNQIKKCGDKYLPPTLLDLRILYGELDMLEAKEKGKGVTRS